MNVYDATRMADLLGREGYSETADEAEADLVILKAHRSSSPAASRTLAEGRHEIVVMRRQRAVDLVVGPQSYHRLPGLLKQARGGARVADTEFAVEDKFDALPQPSRAQIRARGVSAFVTVQEGCDKFCSFCVVPYTRGAEVSRPVADILAETRRLVDAGVREITLIGQNVNAYRGEDEAGRSTNGALRAAARRIWTDLTRGCATPPVILSTWRRI